jgi:hypothetical protein
LLAGGDKRVAILGIHFTLGGAAGGMGEGRTQ